MRFLEKFLIFLFSVIIIAVGGLSIYAAFNATVAIDTLTYLISANGVNWIMLASGVAAIFIGFLIMLCVAFKKSKKAPKTNEVDTIAEGGNVKLSTNAINAIVNETGKNIRGIKKINSTYAASPAGLVVKCTISLSADGSVLEATDQLKTKIKTNLENLGGINVASVNILVEDVTVDVNAPVKSKAQAPAPATTETVETVEADEIIEGK